MPFGVGHFFHSLYTPYFRAFVAPRQPKLTDAQRWILAANAQHALLRGEVLGTLHNGMTSANERWVLEHWWGISSAHDVRKMAQKLAEALHESQFQAMLAKIEELTDDVTFEWFASQLDPEDAAAARFVKSCGPRSSILAWDLIRVIQIYRSAFVAGYVDEAEVWQSTLPMATRLQRTYESWHALGDGFMRGLRFWHGGEPDVAQHRYDAIDRWLRTENESPWERIEWNTRLK